MKTIKTITKRFSFCYGHHLPGYDGKCQNQHGHNVWLEVELIDHNSYLGYDKMIIDFGDLKEIVIEEVIDKLDHKNLNDFMDIPIAENIIDWIWDKLDAVFGDQLNRIKLTETDNSWVEKKRERSCNCGNNESL